MKDITVKMGIEGLDSNIDLQNVPDELVVPIIDIIEEGLALKVQNHILLGRIDLGRGDLSECSCLIMGLKDCVGERAFEILIEWMGFREIDGEVWINPSFSSVEVCEKMDKVVEMLQPGINKVTI